MAEVPKKRRQLRKIETVRERSEKPTKKPRVRRLHGAKKHLSGPLGKLSRFGRQEYYLPLPNNKAGKFLNKRRRFIPKYFRESFAELRQVEWPTKKVTLRLSMAVFVFAVFFGLVVAVTDYGLDKLFKALIIK